MASPASRLIFAVVAPVQRFFRLEAAGGLVLAAAAALALVLANSRLGDAYTEFVHFPIRVGAGTYEATTSLHGFVNDVLMTVFFAVAGMEIKREIAGGELRTLRRAALPLVAAAGGMLVPALIYLALNGRSAQTRGGWAIPTATDIAFALGCLSLVRRRIPWSLFVFLTALAIFDDLGAILIIAVGYGAPTTAAGLALPIALTSVLVVLARLRVQRPWLYLLVGAALWFAVARAGLHPTLAGVAVGLAIPTTARRQAADTLRDLDIAIERLRQLPAEKAEGALAAIAGHVQAMQPPVERLLHGLHAPVAFGIVPLFAFANAGIVVGAAHLTPSVAWGTGAALVLGKFVGVFGAVWLAVRTRLSPLPTGARWPQIAGVALVAGIGFTMSLFVTQLAFPGDASLAMSAKLGVLSGSLVSSVAGLAVLRAAGPRVAEEPSDLAVYHLDMPRFADGYRVASWETTPDYDGKTLAESALRRDRAITVLGVFREHGATEDGVRLRTLESVGPTHVLRQGETMLVVGENAHVAAFLDGPSA